MKNKSSERWHGGHHYSNKIHFALIIFLFLTATTLFWSYLKISDISKKVEKIPNTPPSISGSITPTPSCKPRPACLDSFPRCLIPETSDMRPPAQKPSDEKAVFCTQDAMQCPDGSWVGRTGPKCQFVCP